MIRLVSWNVGQGDPWPDLDGLDADVALLQELGLAMPPSTVERLPDVSYALETWRDSSDPLQRQSVVPPEQVQ